MHKSRGGERDSRLWRRAPVHSTLCCAVSGKLGCVRQLGRKPIVPTIASTLESLSILFRTSRGGAQKCSAAACLAEREGFEPPDGCPSTVFKTAAIDRSAISP